jgi:outer membrane protein OmpA-like peptidoglycan-associated protein
MHPALHLWFVGLGLLAPNWALAGPPALPEGDPDAGEVAPTDAADAASDPAPPADPDSALPPGDVGVDGGIDARADFSTAEPSAGISGRGAASADDGDDDDEASGPGMVRGRREPMMPTNRGGIGLFHTSLPNVGGKYTFRFRIHTDFFRKEGFIFEGTTTGPDQHARVRGGVAIGFTPFEWNARGFGGAELFFSVNSQANRNERRQVGRQDAEAIFALGDIDFGTKVGHMFEKVGIGVGGQLGMGLLSGSTRLRTSKVNFWFDGLASVDLRYLTQKEVPFRFTTNLGWMLDNSLGVANFAGITDDVSAEVTRFALGANHSRLRMRYAVDFPVRLGKEKQFGIDPLLEWGWDVSTTEEPFFAQSNLSSPSPLPRSSQWLTIGLRANVISGLHVDAGVDVGLVSPNFEYGPPVPPWQMILGLGWSFDPNPVVKKVPTESKPPPAPEPVREGRLLGRVVDPAGTPVPEAKILFPGMTSSIILTDASGSFTSYRFPEGPVTVQVMIGQEVVHEASAEIVRGQDTDLQIQIEQAATAVGIVQGAFTDSQGNPIAVRVHVRGQGVDESFNSTEAGLIALELDAGDYQATVSAAGHKDASVSFTVPDGGETQVKAQLELDKPPETPNISASGKSIRLRKAIRYSGNEVAASSHAILDELATFLQYHGEYEVIEIGVHTDDRGAAKKRSDDRAESVKSYLVGKGISSSRIETRGYGASAPVAVNMTAAGRAKNNRTAITVKQKK